MTYPDKALEVYSSGIQSTVKVIYRVLDRIIFRDKINQSVVVAMVVKTPMSARLHG